ncbi:MAG: lysophospholipid acyltransferase family protein [Opitutaceae bacterium]
MLQGLKNAYFQLVYWIAWALFGGGGLLLTLAFLPLTFLPHTERRSRFVRRSLQRLFQLYVGIFRHSGILRMTWIGFDRPLPRQTVYVANHPGLPDALFLLSRLPDAICVFKPKLLRNPAIGPVAVLAGYASGGGGVDAVRDSAARVLAGRSLLIFPEGTRTAPGVSVGPLQSGFALIAARAQAPIQLVILRATEGLATRGRPWWKMPAVIPARVVVQLDRRWDNTASIPAAQLTREVEARIREVILVQGEGCEIADGK